MYFHDCNGEESEKIGLEEDAPLQWNTQSVNITTIIKVKIDFNLPALSAKNVVKWNYHVDDSTKGRYNTILGKDLLT